MKVNINGVLNPSPALTTASFVVKLGVDYSANSTTVSLTPASLLASTITFSPTQVNTTGDMIINITLLNALPKNGSIVVKFAPSLQWSRDLSTNHPIPITGTLSCTLLNSATLTYINSLTCSGSDQNVYINPIYSNTTTLQ